jgi:quinol monooxygenase YgiN
MYARSTTAQGDPSTLDEAIAFVGRKEFPAITGIPGCIGLSMLADRESGRVIVSSAWADAESLQASKEMVRPMQDRLMQMLKAEDALIQSWEVGVLHRERPSGPEARATVAWSRIPADRIDGMLDAYRTTMLPRLQQLPGFCSLSFVVDRVQGRTVSVAAFENADALAGSREQATQQRDQFAAEVGARIHDVAEMDLVVAHLGIPETV